MRRIALRFFNTKHGVIGSDFRRLENVLALKQRPRKRRRVHVARAVTALFNALMLVIAKLALLSLIPFIVTGGFHVDGFMDVSDALSSFKTREEKLAILKDPHIGAFAVIRLAVCGLIYIASLIIVIASGSAAALVNGIAAGFVLSRCLSALSVLTFNRQKKRACFTTKRLREPLGAS